MDAVTAVPAGSASPSLREGAGSATSEVSPWRRLGVRVRPHVVALLGYLGLTAAIYWPLVIHPTGRVLADSNDGAFYLWDLWSFPREVLHGHNPFHTAAVFHPLGANL